MTAASALPSPQPVRPLADDEREALIALIEHGTESIDGRVIDARRRAGWLAQVPVTFAGLRCECGACPSIDLVDARGSRRDFCRFGTAIPAEIATGTATGTDAAPEA